MDNDKITNSFAKAIQITKMDMVFFVKQTGFKLF